MAPAALASNMLLQRFLGCAAQSNDSSGDKLQKLHRRRSCIVECHWYFQILAADARRPSAAVDDEQSFNGSLLVLVPPNIGWWRVNFLSDRWCGVGYNVG